jgi:hypothetical protein
MQFWSLQKQSFFAFGRQQGRRPRKHFLGVFLLHFLQKILETPWPEILPGPRVGKMTGGGLDKLLQGEESSPLTPLKICIF